MSEEQTAPANDVEITGYECKHAQYVKGTPKERGGTPDDMIFIKENIHYADGSVVPNTRMMKNFRRPFWITKPGFQNHEDWKEWEDVDKLDRYECTQAELIPAIKRALGQTTNPVNSYRRIARSPYLYGSDITPTAIIKHRYMTKYPEYIGKNTLAILDLETDVLKGTGDPIYGAVTMKNKVVLAATEQFIGNVDDFETKMYNYFYKRLPEVAKERNIELEVVKCANPLELIKTCIDRAHQWQPDFLAIWNINFDIPKIMDTIEKFGGHAGDIFSDPKVPRPFRKAWYKEGPSKKVTSSGKEEPLHWVDRWHTLYAPASFYVVDQACVFRKLRMAGGREESYALDAILKKYTDTKKLKNEKADQMSGLEWHQYMQSEEPLEYGVYNIYDCISCEILDEQPEVRDLQLSISMQCGHSDYDKFSSQPRRTVDDLHYFCQKHGKIIASTSDDLKTEFDEMTTSIAGWIVTLPAHLVEQNGLKVVNEYPDHNTHVRGAVYDLDVSAAYPNGEDTLNCGKATCVAEVVKIEGVSEEVRRRVGLNLTAGTVNAAEILTSICGAPTFDELLADFEANEGVVATQ